VNLDAAGLVIALACRSQRCGVVVLDCGGKHNRLPFKSFGDDEGPGLHRARTWKVVVESSWWLPSEKRETRSIPSGVDDWWAWPCASSEQRAAEEEERIAWAHWNFLRAGSPWSDPCEFTVVAELVVLLGAAMEDFPRSEDVQGSGAIAV